MTASLSSMSDHQATEQRTQTWALVIATYKRADMLVKCLRLAAEQTRPPSEIVVVDASPDWQATRQRVMDELGPQYSSIRWIYEPARIASAAAQRNQGVDLATADVVFIFDDDSLMYPDCAEQIMRVYEADRDGQIGGVQAAEVDRPPDASTTADEGEPAIVLPKRRGNRLQRWVRGLLSADRIFVPYDDDYPDRPLPPQVCQLHTGRTRTMPGMTMTLRRDVAATHRFEEILADRGPEDSDITYRISRQYALAMGFAARVHHVGSPAGRFSSFSRKALGALGPIVLHRIYSTDLNRSRRRSRRMLMRRLFIELIKDLRQGQLSLPGMRGIWFALRHLNRVLAMSEAELRQWYPQLQRRVLGRDE